MRLGDAARVVLVHRDHHARGTRIDLAQVHHLTVRLEEHGGQPLALDVERRAQALARAGAPDRVVEARRLRRAVGRRPLHVPVDSREVDGPHDTPVAQRLAVAVLVVGVRLLPDVAHEGDGALVRPKRRSRQAEPDGCQLEGVPDAISP